MLNLNKLHELGRLTADRVIRDYPEKDKIILNIETLIHEAIVQHAKAINPYKDMLEKHVWHKRSSDGEYFCIECRNNKRIGHARGCKLVEMLKGGEG